ncbi:sn-glycerol-3-phosphate ABC transporter permease UgpE [Cysteiniphilum halobium]|uniref:sn-glycerol-3-phosphate ABC transporter permease UgpE n=1 Tax=Cysteiniphilum halobium TaxID=2219059 RepID=UPI003F835C88
MMVERRPVLTFMTHALLILGIVIMLLPIYVAFVTSTQSIETLNSATQVIPMLPGHDFVTNYQTALVGSSQYNIPPALLLLWNSFLMALAIAVGKIVLALISAYAVVYFNFRFKMLFFWAIFLTLMLPVEVRIVPTYDIVVNLGMLNTFAGLTLPLIASATATFMFRQFFMTIPRQYAEAAAIDGAGPIRFFIDVVLPLSKTNIVALFIVMFIYGWNQFLWPLIITSSDQSLHTIVMGLMQVADTLGQIPNWNFIMAEVMLATVIPVLIVIIMQRWFVKGLMETDK